MPFMAAGVYLEKSIVQAAFEYSLRENVTLCGFLGDECVTLKHTPEIQVSSWYKILSCHALLQLSAVLSTPMGVP